MYVDCQSVNLNRPFIYQFLFLPRFYIIGFRILPLIKAWDRHACVVCINMSLRPILTYLRVETIYIIEKVLSVDES